MLARHWFVLSIALVLLVALVSGCTAATPTPSTPAPTATKPPATAPPAAPTATTPPQKPTTPATEVPKAPTPEDAAAYYKGKTISYVVGFPPGGGYDYFARVTAPYIQKYTGADKIIVDNKPGAGGLLAYNSLYNEAKPDGLTICIAQGPSLFSRAILEAEGSQYDLDKFTILGRIAYEPVMAAAAVKTGWKSVADVKAAAKAQAAVTSKDDLSGVSASLLSEAAGLTKMKLVPGYSGSSEAILSVIRGETDIAIGYSATTLLKNIQAGQLQSVVMFAKERYPKMNDVPTVFEAGLLPGKENLMDILIAGNDIGRLIIAPPNMPERTRVLLHEAIAKALQDPELADKVAKEQKLDMGYLDGPKTKEMLSKVTNISPALRAQLKTIILEKYY